MCCQVAQAYLEDLLREGRFEEAANLCPRLLKVGDCAPATPKLTQSPTSREVVEFSA